MLRLPTLVLVFASALCAQDDRAPNDRAQKQQPASAALPAVLQATAARYNAAEWPRSERRAGLDLAAIELRGFTGGAVEPMLPGPRQRWFADEKGENRVMAEVFVENDAAVAGERLVWWLAHVSNPRPMPTAADSGMPVGDAGYVGWSDQKTRRIAWIAFVRGNVAVRVSCLDPSVDPHPDLAAIVQAVDAAILREPVVAAQQPLPRPAVERFAAAQLACRAGDVVPLDVKVADPAGAATNRFVIEGPGQGWVDQDAEGKWRLHTTGAGRLTVHLHTTGVRGLAATSKLTIDVSERR